MQAADENTSVSRTNLPGSSVQRREREVDVGVHRRGPDTFSYRTSACRHL